jgi:DNA polymerase-3 subunit alpha
LDFELLTISNSGYPGYFLIVQDLIASRSMGVSGAQGVDLQQDQCIIV